MNAECKRRAAKLLAAAALWAAALPAVAQFPTKPIHIVVPYQAGGTSEMMARSVADQLQSALKQPVVIDNRPGGGTPIGAAAVAQAPADG
jgi:tripartite-type tricarboxylate transporter receptor subunit TctC